MKKVLPILLLLVFFIAAAWYSLTREPEAVHELRPPTLLPETPPAIQEPETPVIDEPPVVTIPAPDPLPLLNESDADVTRVLGGVAGAEGLTQYLVKPQLISRFVAVIDSLTNRQVPPPLNPVKTPDGKFLVLAAGDRVLMSEENFARYDAYVTLLQGMDNDALLGFYQRYYPLFQQGWDEIDGKGPFNERLVGVIDHLLATPDVAGDIFLVKPEAVYLFEDPALEDLSAGQKILLRMGPENAAAVKAKLVQLREKVGTD